MGGPSIFLAFVPSKWRRSYWETAGKAIYGAIVSLATGRGLGAVPHSALIPAKYEPRLAQLRQELARMRSGFPAPRLRAWAAQTRLGLAAREVSAAARAKAAELGLAVRNAIDEALRSAARRLEERGRRVPPRAVELARRLLTESGPRATYWAYMIARYAWAHRSVHTVNALLRGTAHALREHALKRYGSDAHLHPAGFKLLRLADRLELVELLINNRALAERLVWRASLALYERGQEVRVARSVESYAMLVSAQAKALSDAMLRQQRESAMNLLDASRKLELGARELREKAKAFVSAYIEYRTRAESYKLTMNDYRAAQNAGNLERVRELRARLRELAWELREAREALRAARAELRRAEEMLLAKTREVEELVRQLAPAEVRGYIEQVLRDASELAARAREMGPKAYMLAAEHLKRELELLASNEKAPGWVREAARSALEEWRQLVADWKAVYAVEKLFERLQEQAAKGEALAPPKVELPQPSQPSAVPAGLEELWRTVQRMGDELREAVALHDARMHKLFEEYIAALERVEKLAAGTPLAELARQEREAWLAARDELLAPPEVLHLRGEAERLAEELRKALDAKDYLTVERALPEYAELLARLSEAPAPHIAGWAREELEKLNKVRDELLLPRYYELTEALGGEPLAALEGKRFTFELTLSLAHVSADAAKPLLDRIEDRRLRDYAAGYLEAARAYAKAREEAGEQALARIQEEFSSLPTPEAKAGFLAYAIERSLPFIDFGKFGSAARIVEEAFWDEAKRLALYPEPEDWERLLDEFERTYDPEVLGKALAHAALAGEVNEFRQDGRVKGFVERCHGDVARFEWWVEQRPKVEEEVTARLRVIDERLSVLEERATALHEEWAPEPGEAVSLQMHAELRAARAREEVLAMLHEADELRAELEAERKRAEDFLLPTHPFDAFRDRINRLVNFLTKLGDALG
jgi:hypothetical protein